MRTCTTCTGHGAATTLSVCGASLHSTERFNMVPCTGAPGGSTLAPMLSNMMVSPGRVSAVQFDNFVQTRRPMAVREGAHYASPLFYTNLCVEYLDGLGPIGAQCRPQSTREIVKISTAFALDGQRLCTDFHRQSHPVLNAIPLIIDAITGDIHGLVARWPRSRGPHTRRGPGAVHPRLIDSFLNTVGRSLMAMVFGCGGKVRAKCGPN